jgi:CDP-diacylglycerol--glycerol-3-phosphate 3-phosphatidyltransferase
MASSAALLNVPNLLTLGRIAAIPVLIWLLLYDTPLSCFGAAAVFGLAAITDFLDGYLARRQNIVTVLGKFLDPLADKLIVMAALIMLIPLQRVPAWAVFVILAREQIVTGLRSIASSQGVVIDACNLGKYKTITQMIAIIALLLHYDYYWLFGIRQPWLQVSMHQVGLFYFYLALILTVWSGIHYLVKFFRVIGR